MSSILKALKKIETRTAETKLPTWPYRINNRESMSRHTHRTWRRQRILGILIVVCGVALAGRLYYAGRPGPESTSPKADLSEITVLPDVSEGRTKTDRRRADAGAKPIPLPPAVSRKTLPAAASDSSPPESPKKAPVEVTPTVPTDNAGLTLQALVWSEQPEDRFVVINGSIIREGGTINGSAVSQIESDSVTIRSGGTTWRLKYGHGP